jgi:hypothetical protein
MQFFAIVPYFCDNSQFCMLSIIKIIIIKIAILNNVNMFFCGF